jgi:glucose/arabinose dehydrogenase
MGRLRGALEEVVATLSLPAVVLLLLLSLLQAVPGPLNASGTQETRALRAGATFTPTELAYLPLVFGGVGPTITLTEQVDGLESPTHVTHAGDGSGRLFVTERAGRVRVIRNGTLLSTPFLSITERITSARGEQGLLSVAFPPGYGSKGYFYVDYTDLNGDTVVARYHVTDEPDLADPNSEEVILTQAQPYANHNGGQLAFGPDGYLYIAMGDGGGGGDPEGNAQDPTSLLGKILRIDVESGATPYSIPASNPYTETTDYRAEIWALGLRNPWRFSFDRLTGDLYIGDVGQNTYEEIDYQAASSAGGENYGWNIMEGRHCYPGPPCDESGLVLPVAEYDHSVGCSVTGGTVYRGAGGPNLEGIYFYGDYCSGRIWGLVREEGRWQVRLLSDTDLRISSFGEDETGNLYVVDFAGGTIHQIREAP